MTRNTSLRLAALALGLATALFLLLLWLLAGWGMDAGYFLLLAIPVFLALFSAAAWLSYGKSRALHRGTWMALLLVVLFYAGLKPEGNWRYGMSQKVVDAFAGAYRVVYDVSPHEAHNRATEWGLVELLRQGLKAQDGEKLDLRGLNIRDAYEKGAWTRLCIFAPRTSDAFAHELANFSFAWDLDSYGFHRESDKYATILLATPSTMAGWDSIPESVAVVPESFCVPREKAVLRRLAPAGDGLGPTLSL